MRTWSFALGSVHGIRISIDISWFIALLFVTEIYMPEFRQAPIWAFVLALSIYLSVLLHECAHVVIAARKKIRTSEIVLNLFGGTAIMEEPSNAADEWKIALAGPVLSLILGAFLGIFDILIFATLPPGTVVERDSPLLALTIAAVANFLIAGVNLMPIYPLDGGRILRSLIVNKTHNPLRAISIACGLTVILGGALISWGAWQSMLNNHVLVAVLRMEFGTVLIIQALSAYHAVRRRSATVQKSPAPLVLEKKPV